MLNITDENFEAEVAKSDIPVVVDFFAHWCTPCKVMGPIFEEVGKKYNGKVKFVKINVDEARETAMKYEVMSIPTIITYKNGVVVDTLVGLQDESSLTEKAEGLMKK
jgi:thioredoxin 1